MTCPKCQSGNTRTIRELFDPQRTALYCDECRHLWKPEAPVYLETLPKPRVRGFDRLFKKLAEVLR